jgi:hypothetical protein
MAEGELDREPEAGEAHASCRGVADSDSLVAELLPPWLDDPELERVRVACENLQSALAQASPSRHGATGSSATFCTLPASDAGMWVPGSTQNEE